ncbi:MAG: hypothetical protein JSV20_09840 [Candidatus Bathyarchaeota archaeon]|nr:MAG: hypothetical protein JSV20_09840 [Candidatus Bathyarchaeota archaeon]
MPRKVVDKKEISISEAKNILEKLGELNLFQLRTYNYIAKLSKITPVNAEELINKLVEKFDLSRKMAVQLVNCMPKSIEEIRAFLSINRKKIFITSQIKEMLEMLDNHR